jgi:nitrous oxide reductase accessory protein NosL
MRVLFAAIAASALLAGCAKSPESALESFHTALSKGEITEAQTYVSSQISGMLGPQKLSAMLQKEAEIILRCGGVKSLETKLDGKGEIRSGQSTITYSGKCAPKKINVKLVKEDGKWKIGAE